MSLGKGILCILAVAAAGSLSAAELPAQPVMEATLKNGLRVVIVPDHLAPVVNTVMNYRVGSDEAPAGFPGMAHAQEHMMFRGSPGLSANQLAAIGAGMGGRFDADTQQSVTQYTFTVPADDLDVALRIEALRMRGVLDSQALWREERGAIEQEVARDLSSPEYVAYSDLLRQVFHRTPYSHDALGTIPSFNQTTGAMLQQFHRAWYAPNDAVLVIVGDVQPDTVLTEVKKLFDSIPRRALPARPAFQFQPVTPETLRLNSDLPYALALIAFRMPGEDSPDYAAARVLSDVLNNQRGTLGILAAEGKALQTGFELMALPRSSLGFAVAAFPAGSGAQKQIAQVRTVLAGDLKTGFPADLVAASRRDALLGAELHKTSIFGLAMDWSQAVAIEGHRSPSEDLAAIERVTPADVDRVAHKYLDLNHAVVAVLTPQPAGKALPASPPKGPESFTPTHAKPVAVPAWAETAVTSLSMPKWDLHLTDIRLSNGLRLIVQPESVSDTVSIFGHIRNDSDLETPQREKGVASVLENLFPYGTQTMSRMAFQKALNDIGATEHGGTDFSLQVLSRYFGDGLMLLASDELHPGMRGHDFQIVRDQVAGMAAGRLKSPAYLASRSLDSELFPPKDPTLRQATPASVSALTLQDVQRYFRRVYRPDLTTIVVIGNISRAAAIEAVQKYFGGWGNAGPAPPTDLPVVPANPPGFASVPDPSRVQDEVVMAEALGLNRFNPDYYALSLGNHILGGGFYATRLYRDLRENTGLVYTVHSQLAAGRTRGLYKVTFGCEPANAGRAAAIVRQDIEEMRAAPASATELRQAKVLALHEIPLAETSEDQIAAGLLSRSNESLPLDEPMRAATHYLQLTGEQVRAAFAKWLRPGAWAEVIQGPAVQTTATHGTTLRGAAWLTKGAAE